MTTAPRPPQLRVQNVVAIFEATPPLISGEHLACHFPGASFNAARFSHVRLRTAQWIALVFASGKVVCPGNRSVAGARIAALQLVRLLLDTGYNAQLRNFRIKNIACSCATHFELDLDSIMRAHSAHCQYDATKFPGLFFKLRSTGGTATSGGPPIVTFICYVSGKCVITGACDAHVEQTAWNWFYTNVLWPHRFSRALTGCAGATAPTSSAMYRKHVRARTSAPDAVLRAIFEAHWHSGGDSSGVPPNLRQLTVHSARIVASAAASAVPALATSDNVLYAQCALDLARLEMYKQSVCASAKTAFRPSAECARH